MDLTPDQIDQLKALGIALETPPETLSNTPTNDTININMYGRTDVSDPATAPISPPSLAKLPDHTISSTQDNRLLSIIKTPLFPLFSISGLTLISFGGLLLLKGKNDAATTPPSEIRDLTSDQLPEPTQVPKSIQHYLLASQQYFTQALQFQNTEPTQVPDLVNQAILAATDAVKQFPDDYRGYQQRSSIYQALADSQPQFLDSALSDLAKASQLNPGSAELTRTLATLYAKKGDAQNTLLLLARTVALEPTKAQNFYDLARIQQQTGQIEGALDTYTRLLTLVADPAQKTQVESEVASLQKLASQNPSAKTSSPASPTTTIDNLQSIPDSPNLIQADAAPGLIIAAPETVDQVKVSSLTDSNALSGTATLTAGQTSIPITNTNLTPESKIYLTIVSGGKNKTLQTLSRSGTTFTVGLDTPANEDITFKWWLVNQ